MIEGLLAQGAGQGGFMEAAMGALFGAGGGALTSWGLLRERLRAVEVTQAALDKTVTAQGQVIGTLVTGLGEARVELARCTEAVLGMRRSLDEMLDEIRPDRRRGERRN